MSIFHIEYSSNNSGGGWWLKDRDWLALEKSGWCIHWFKDEPKGSHWQQSMRKDGLFLGARAVSACKDFEASDEHLAEKIASVDWENCVHQDPLEEGCPCCGRPHSFYNIKREGCNCTSYYGSREGIDSLNEM